MSRRRDTYADHGVSETLAHVACLRWLDIVERRTRADGVYEWYSTSDAPLAISSTGPVPDA